MKGTASRTKSLEGLEYSRQKTCQGYTFDRPLVSIIVNNYNYGQFLPEAIDSALNQIYSSVEVIVVDDGSTDHSREIIASYSDRIIPVLKENGGQASAFNAGFKASTGEIIIFLDADDYLFSHTVEQVIAAWQPDAAKVHYLLEMVDSTGKHLGTHPPRPLDSGEVWQTLLQKGRYGTPVTSGNGFRRAVLEEILPMPETEFQIAADGYLMALVPFYGQIVSINRALGAYRIHGQNLWALTMNIEGERLRKFVQHDLQRYSLLERIATKLGHRVPKDLSYRDYLHLKVRVASLSLNPRSHPVPSDSRLFLTLRALWAVWRYSDLSGQKRLLFSLWFTWVGLAPLAMVKPAITWLFVPHCRPRSLDWVGIGKKASAARKLSSV